MGAADTVPTHAVLTPPLGHRCAGQRRHRPTPVGGRPARALLAGASEANPGQVLWSRTRQSGTQPPPHRLGPTLLSRSRSGAAPATLTEEHDPKASEKPGIPRPPSRATSPTPSAGPCFWSPSRAQPTSRCRVPYRIGIVEAPAWQGSGVCRRVPFPPCPAKCCVRPSQLQANCRGGGMSCWGLHTASHYVSPPYPLGSLTVGPTWFLHQPS